MGFGPAVTPPVVKQLLIANFVVFAVQTLFTQGWQTLEFDSLFALTPADCWSGHLWQPFTYMFLHGNLLHLLMNMFVFWMFGSPLALVWGPKRFLRFYLFCGVFAGFLIATLPYVTGLLGLHFASLSPDIPTLGASGAIYGVILGYSLTWPNRTVMLIFPPVAFRAIWLIPVLFLLEVMFGPANVSHVGHLGGAAGAWLYLQREQGGGALGLPSLQQLRYRWRRYRMRSQLRAIRRDETLRDRSRESHDRTLH
ncbi:MAG TPA: rhomboid family intramembrane serine protease [Myxococcota bacterium]|nr:rhomboid family intramembrane serine protease [Myxococcota bacterium]